MIPNLLTDSLVLCFADLLLFITAMKYRHYESKLFHRKTRLKLQNDLLEWTEKYLKRNWTCTAFKKRKPRKTYDLINFLERYFGNYWSKELWICRSSANVFGKIMSTCIHNSNESKVTDVIVQYVGLIQTTKKQKEFSDGKRKNSCIYGNK